MRAGGVKTRTTIRKICSEVQSLIRVMVGAILPTSPSSREVVVTQEADRLTMKMMMTKMRITVGKLEMDLGTLAAEEDARTRMILMILMTPTLEEEEVRASETHKTGCSSPGEYSGRSSPRASTSSSHVRSREATHCVVFSALPIGKLM